ncbi:hypothetical protein HDV02_004782 [Globomyces sp. JEL0801]|nr:hypothetical protein HDV02_004782 [Globomyces sp. JEL0801]
MQTNGSSHSAPYLKNSIWQDQQGNSNRVGKRFITQTSSPLRNFGEMLRNSSSPYSSHPSDPDTLRKVIKCFDEMDIQTDHTAYCQWLTSKNMNRTKEKEQMPSKRGYYNMESLEMLTETEVDALLNRLQKNKNSYERWKMQKDEKAFERKKLEEKEMEKKMKRELHQQKEMEKRKQRIQAQVEKWTEGKKMQMKELAKDMEQLEKGRKQESLMRLKLNEKAFQEWLKTKENKMEMDSRDQIEIRKKPQWIHPNNTPKISSIKKPTQSTESAILSPPSLYNEYSFYQKTCPKYFRKYNILIASGGKPIDGNESKTAKPKVQNKQSVQKKMIKY